MTGLDRQLEAGVALIAAGIVLLLFGSVPAALIVAGIVLIAAAIQDFAHAHARGQVRVR